MCDQQTLSLLIGMLSPITGLILLCLQVYTYLKTRHNSVLVLTVSSVVGMGCWGLTYLQWTNHVPDTTKKVLVLTASTLLIIQCVLCIWGSAALFRAFRHFVASSGSGDSPSATVLQTRSLADQLSAAPLEPIGLASDSSESSLLRIRLTGGVALAKPIKYQYGVHRSWKTLAEWIE